ncbi:MAG: hypothetical protein OZ948_11755 [Deltaproteobacteria bacterium]|nr:hypothetical protein [Deltaproteobacteria bacterium]
MSLRGAATRRTAGNPDGIARWAVFTDLIGVRWDHELDGRTRAKTSRSESFCTPVAHPWRAAAASRRRWLRPKRVRRWPVREVPAGGTAARQEWSGCGPRAAASSRWCWSSTTTARCDLSGAISRLVGAEFTILLSDISDAQDLARVAVIAEGVEHELQRDALRGFGCDEMQGFLLAPALPAAEVERFFQDPRGSGSDTRRDLPRALRS